MVKLVYSPEYVMDWWDHVFPVDKYLLVYQKLISEGVCTADDFVQPRYATEEELLTVHSKKYLTTLEEFTKFPQMGLPIFEIPVTREILDRFILVTGGSIIAGELALRDGASGNLAGGFHHAFSDHGEGFCLLNDIAVLIRCLQKKKLIKNAVVIDCDLHQGNGTAKIFENDKSVFTFSIHQEYLYPIKQKSSWDIGLDNFVGDEEYLSKLEYAVNKILDQTRYDILVYVAGADPYEEDMLGSLKLTKNGLIKRDKIVFDKAKEKNTPVVVLPAGGYSKNKMDVVEIHFNTFKLLMEYFR